MIKGDGNLKYLFTIIDTAIYAYLVGQLGKNNTFLAILVYTVGKLSGLFLSDIVSDRIEKKIYQINLYLKEENLEQLQAYLVSENISFTKFEGDFLGQSRFLLSIHISRQQKASLLSKLKQLGINPTMDVSEVKVDGKIKKRIANYEDSKLEIPNV